MGKFHLSFKMLKEDKFEYSDKSLQSANNLTFKGNMQNIVLASVKNTTDISDKKFTKEPLLREIIDINNAKLFKAGQFDVVSLKGDYYQMGVQYGLLQKHKIRNFYNDIVQSFKEAHIINSTQDLVNCANRLLKDYPPKYIKMLEGIALGSDMKVIDIAIINIFMEVLEAKCSCIVAGGEYTRDKTNIMGRNFDYPEFFKRFDDYLTVITLKPDDGSNPVALLTYTGQITAPQVFNSKGMVIEVNNAMIGDNRERISDKPPFVLTNLDAMLKSSDLEELDKEIHLKGSSCPILFNVADADNAYCYEITTTDIKKRSPEKEGLLVSTNHFINNKWPESVREFLDYRYHSKLRRKNLLNIAQNNKGNITEQTVKDILDTTIENGGATFTDKTVFQFVFTPKTKQLEIKAPGYSDWTTIPLSELL
ncbi:MAG: C45 family autoproteolytic acyltransferase/hydrolase [Vampirovibrionia bacterium]